MSVTGKPGDGPMRVGIPIADLSAGFMLAQGLLIALLEREVSGEGQWVYTSLLEAQIQMMDFQAARYLLFEEVPTQQGNNHPTFLPAGVFETADGRINIQSGPQHLWERLAHALEVPELLENPDYASLEKRYENREALHEAIARRTRTKPGAEWIEILNEAGIPCGPIYTVDQTFADSQVKGLNMSPEVRASRDGADKNRGPGGEACANAAEDAQRGARVGGAYGRDFEGNGLRCGIDRSIAR